MPEAISHSTNSKGRRSPAFVANATEATQSGSHGPAEYAIEWAIEHQIIRWGGFSVDGWWLFAGHRGC